MCYLYPVHKTAFCFQRHYVVTSELHKLMDSDFLVLGIVFRMNAYNRSKLYFSEVDSVKLAYPGKTQHKTNQNFSKIFEVSLTAQ